MRFAEPVEVVGVDGDDTLWRCQDAFDAAEVEVARLLAPYADAERVQAALARTERGNLSTYGFGVKSWVLNVLQVAEELGGPPLGGFLAETTGGFLVPFLLGDIVAAAGAGLSIDVLRAGRSRRPKGVLS